MALIKCPECGREISQYADKCPGCGWPVPKPGETADGRDREYDEYMRQRNRAASEKGGGKSGRKRGSVPKRPRVSGGKKIVRKNRKKSSAGTVFISVIVTLLILAMLATAAYYYFFIYKEDRGSGSQPAQTQQVQEEEYTEAPQEETEAIPDSGSDESEQTESTGQPSGAAE